MTEKQYRKADSLVFPTLLVVVIGIFLNMLGMNSTGEMNGAIRIVTMISAIGIVMMIVVYTKMKGTRKCGIYMLVVATTVWAFMTILVDAQFFYILAAALFIAQMAYLEKIRIVISAAVVVPIYMIKSLMLSGKGAVSATEAGTSIVILVLIIVSVYNITKIWITFNSENLNTVRYVSEELVQHFDEANEYVKALDEAINTSSMSMQDIATNIESTAHEIQNQSQMCQDIGDNTGNAKRQTATMVQASGEALEEVVSGAETMDKLHNHAQEVGSDNEATVKYVVALNERTKVVEDILATIMGISTQTHLLALNASIEAARAGEAGKGFAVVAEEIRGLSDQTKTSTENITEILVELKEDVERVTESINHSVKTIEEQNNLIEETKGKFDAIEMRVNQLMSTINVFKRVIDEITEASGVISEGITELSANSQEVAAASNDGTRVMTRAVKDMNQVKSALNNIYSLAQNLRNEYNVK